MLKFSKETEFKETEIGKIPRDWVVKELGDIVDIKHGFAFPSKYFNRAGKIPVLKIKNIKEDNTIDLNDIDFIYPEHIKKNISKYYLKNGDILIALTGATAGKIGIIQGKYAKYLLNQRVGKFEIIDNESTLLFVFYSLIYEPYRDILLDLADGSAQGNMSPSDLKNYIKIPSPPSSEQSRIATVLSWFYDLIENKKRQNEILEKTAMAIFKSWFIDFEPFKNEEFVYNEELDKEIPKGWKVDNTTEVIEYNPTLHLSKGLDYPFIEMKDVNKNSMVCNYQLKKFTGSGVKFRGGDTLMARITPSLEHGKTAFVWFINENAFGFGSTEFFVLHPKFNYLKEFVYLLSKTKDYREVAINSMTGTSGRQRADVNSLKYFLIPIPPQPIFQKFHNLVEPLFKKIILNQKEIIVLRKIRDALLPQLVFGKLRVEEL